MAKTGPQRPKDTTPQDRESLVDPDFAELFFDSLAELDIARSLNELVAARGINLDIYMHELFAARQRDEGKPLSPKLREYIATHDPKMTPETRKRFGLDFS